MNLKNLCLIIFLLAIVIVPVSAATNTTPYDANIKALFHFNQTAGPSSTFYDDSPYHVTLTTSGSATSNSTAGWHTLGNASVYLNGVSSQYVYTAADSSGLYNPAGCWTHMMYFNPYDSASQTDRALIVNYKDASNYYVLTYANGRVYYGSYSGGSLNGRFYTDVLSWTDNVAYQIVVEKLDDYHAVVYRDGTLIPITYTQSGVGVSGGTNQQLYVGHDPSGGYYDARGFFDEVTFWDTAVPITALNPLPYEVRTTPTVAPVASFTITNTTGITPLITNLTDTSTNTPTGWNYTAYNTGNSTEFILSSLQNPTITFPYAGNYSVSLNASNSAGFNKTPQYATGHWVNVSPTVPTAAFSGTPTSGLAPLSVAFTDASTNSPTSWHWDFGDGNTTDNTLQNPVHLYTAAGSYNVNLTATNAYGSGYNYKASYIVVYWPALSAFGTFNTAGTKPFTTYLYDASTNLTPGPVTYSWDLGDGNTSTAQNLYFTWNKTGTFTVIHSMSNGLSTSYSQVNVTVGTPTPPVVAPVASFYGSPTLGLPPMQTYFTDASTNTPTAWNWTWGDGTSTNGTTQNPSHTYTASGIFTVTLTVSNSAGSNTTTKTNFIALY